MGRLPARFAIFDMDGLLLDTENIYTEITQKIVAKYGKTYDWSIKSNMIGRPQMDSARYLVDALSLPITAEQYIEQKQALIPQAFPNCHPMPGAMRLIRHLKQQQIPIAVATSSHRDLFEIKTTHHKDWFSLFDQIITGDDPQIENGKPSPDIFLIAAERIGACADQTLVFEDAPSGLQAGIAANMRVIAVPDPNMDKHRYKDAEQILTTLEDFQPDLFGMGEYSD